MRGVAFPGVFSFSFGMVRWSSFAATGPSPETSTGLPLRQHLHGQELTQKLEAAFSGCGCIPLLPPLFMPVVAEDGFRSRGLAHHARRSAGAGSSRWGKKRWFVSRGQFHRFTLQFFS